MCRAVCIQCFPMTTNIFLCSAPPGMQVTHAPPSEAESSPWRSSPETFSRVKTRDSASSPTARAAAFSNEWINIRHRHTGSMLQSESLLLSYLSIFLQAVTFVCPHPSDLDWCEFPKAWLGSYRWPRLWLFLRWYGGATSQGRCRRYKLSPW